MFWASFFTQKFSHSNMYSCQTRSMVFPKQTLSLFNWYFDQIFFGILLRNVSWFGVELNLHFGRWVLSRVEKKSVNFQSIDQALNTNQNDKCSLKCCQRQFDRIIVRKRFLSFVHLCHNVIFASTMLFSFFFFLHCNGIKIQCHITN